MTKCRVLLIAALMLALALPASLAQDATEITFATWGNTTELAMFNDMIAAFEEAHPDVTVTLLERPGRGYRDQTIVEMAAGTAPDVVRAGFRGDFAFYADAGGTIDLSPFLDGDFEEDFFPAAWTIASVDGVPYGIPFMTDTHALFYNVDYIEQADITVPTSMDECWSWEEFSAMSRHAMDNSDADFGHAALWNGKRWMLFLYGNGGQVLTDDLSTSAMDSDASIETIAWTQSWYDDGLAPFSTSMKMSERADELFINGTIAFFISGSWHLPNLRENMVSQRWDVTYLPCTENGVDADLGGNGFAVTRDSEHPDMAAEFVKFLTNTENMKYFAEQAFFNPVRYSSLQGLEYPEFNDMMLLFAEVAETVDAHHASVQGLPAFPGIQNIIQDELDLAFVAGQSAEQTAQNMHEKINALLDED